MESHSLPSVSNSPKNANISTLYRIQDLNRYLNLLTLVLGVFSPTQRKITNNDVVEHQKSAHLIGSTSSERSLNKLLEKWDRNGVLIINPLLIIDLFDVDKIVKKVGTSFFTEYNELEQCMTILPICAVKTIKYVDKNADQSVNIHKTIDNPFYIDPTSTHVMSEYNLIDQAHKNFLGILYERGAAMSPQERQDELNKLVAAYNDFYQKNLGDKNPFAMTISQLRNLFGENYFKHTFESSNDNDKTIKELIMQEGDKIFLCNDAYKLLLDRKRVENIMKKNEEHGYGSRNSYTY